MEQKKINDVIGTLEYDGDSLMGKTDLMLCSKSYDINIRFHVYEDGFNGLTSKLLDFAMNCIHTLKSRQDMLLSEMVKYEFI